MDYSSCNLFNEDDAILSIFLPTQNWGKQQTTPQSDKGLSESQLLAIFQESPPLNIDNSLFELNLSSSFNSISVNDNEIPENLQPAPLYVNNNEININNNLPTWDFSSHSFENNDHSTSRHTDCDLPSSKRQKCASPATSSSLSSETEAKIKVEFYEKGIKGKWNFSREIFEISHLIVVKDQQVVITCEQQIPLEIQLIQLSNKNNIEHQFNIVTEYAKTNQSRYYNNNYFPKLEELNNESKCSFYLRKEHDERDPKKNKYSTPVKAKRGGAISPPAYRLRIISNGTVLKEVTIFLLSRKIAITNYDKTIQKFVRKLSL